MRRSTHNLCRALGLVAFLLSGLMAGPGPAASAPSRPPDSGKKLDPPLFEDILAALLQVRESSADWGDYDVDGDLDVLLMGWLNGPGASRIFRNDGGGLFHDVGAPLVNLQYGSVAWGDHDNDGDLDALLSGSLYYGHIGYNTQLYRNEGNDNFTDLSVPLTDVNISSVAWGDNDNDGDLDILIAGEYTEEVYTTEIWRNDDNEAFTNTYAPLPAVAGAVAWGDYDGDDDLDVVLTGYCPSGYGQRIARIYRNDGSNSYVWVSTLTGVSDSAVAWGDYDNDADLDLLLAGDVGSGRIAQVYHNNGSDSFTDIGAGLVGVSDGAAAWGDHDNDGDLDILLTGWTGSEYLSIVYRSDAGVFADIDAGLVGVTSRPDSAAWGDYDDDKDLDILLSGYADGPGNLTKIYRNNISTANTPPGAPANLLASVSGHDVTLSWSAPGDDHTPANGLSYNLRVGTSPGGQDVVTPMSMASGLRLVAALGNAQMGLTGALKDLPDGTYYWSVQAVDTAFVGGAFAAERSFQVPGVQVPDIDVEPDELDVTLPPGGTGHETLTVHNLGGADLVWSVSEQPSVAWLSETPTGSTVPGGGSRAVDVFFDASELGEGVYNTTLRFGSNDLDEPQVDVPVTLTVACVDISGLNFTVAPVQPLPGNPATFAATVQGGTAPIAYEWVWGDGGTGSGQTTTHTYAEAGVYPVTLTASNDCPSQQVVQKDVSVLPSQYTFLPLAASSFPPIPCVPVLEEIENGDGDGSYVVSWAPACLADGYVLQAGSGCAVGGYETVYTGPDTSFPISGRGPTRYHYRVKATNEWGGSAWSESESTDVTLELEPNNVRSTEANGPTCSAVTYHGKSPVGDIDDYYYFDLSSSGTAEVWLTDIPQGEDLDLAVRDLGGNLLCWSGNGGSVPEHCIVEGLGPGRCYLQVHDYEDTLNIEWLYSLRTDCP